MVQSETRKHTRVLTEQRRIQNRENQKRYRERQKQRAAQLEKTAADGCKSTGPEPYVSQDHCHALSNINWSGLNDSLPLSSTTTPPPPAFEADYLLSDDIRTDSKDTIADSHVDNCIDHQTLDDPLGCGCYDDCRHIFPTLLDGASYPQFLDDDCNGEMFQAVNQYSLPNPMNGYIPCVDHSRSNPRHVPSQPKQIPPLYVPSVFDLPQVLQASSDFPQAHCVSQYHTPISSNPYIRHRYSPRNQVCDPRLPLFSEGAQSKRGIDHGQGIAL